jgi:predicted nucleotidyltransferase component of viral defense system
VAEETRIAPALVEKDHGVTHCMWALHQTGLDLWFKGGTGLSKGYGIIERLSEDLNSSSVASPSSLPDPPLRPPVWRSRRRRRP